MRSALLGTAPNRRYVVEWNNVEPFNSAVTSTMRFQAKLFETTNVIEFHYCAISAISDPILTGSSASIGVESTSGTAAVLSSFNTANSITLANAIRFTPAP